MEQRPSIRVGNRWLHARSLLREVGLQLANVKIDVRDWSSAFTLVREGIGIALVAQQLISFLFSAGAVTGLSSASHRTRRDSSLYPASSCNGKTLWAAMTSGTMLD